MCLYSLSYKYVVYLYVKQNSQDLVKSSNDIPGHASSRPLSKGNFQFMGQLVKRELFEEFPFFFSENMGVC